MRVAVQRECGEAAAAGENVAGWLSDDLMVDV